MAIPISIPLNPTVPTLLFFHKVALILGSQQSSIFLSAGQTGGIRVAPMGSALCCCCIRGGGQTGFLGILGLMTPSTSLLRFLGFMMLNGMLITHHDFVMMALLQHLLQ